MNFATKLLALDKAATPGPVAGRSGDQSDVVAGPRRIAYVWDSVERELFVTLRNAAPEIAELIEAVGGMLHTIETSVPADAPFSHLLNRDAAEVRAAILSLDEKAPK